MIGAIIGDVVGLLYFRKLLLKHIEDHYRYPFKKTQRSTMNEVRNADTE